MLQNSKVTAFTVFELLSENQLGGKTPSPLPTQIRVKASTTQESILSPLLFLIYINDLPKGLLSNIKLFADGTSLFSVIHYSITSRIDLNDDLVKNNSWTYHGKISFNPDPKKKAQETVFIRKTKKISHLPKTFTKSTVS